MKFDDYLEEQLKDPEFKKEWDGTQEEYAAISEVIKANANKEYQRLSNYVNK